MDCKVGTDHVRAQMRFDILIPRETRDRPETFLKALAETAAKHDVDARVMVTYTPRPDSVLMLYGLGGRDRLPFADRHLRGGGRTACWDAGYWGRKGEDRYFRLAFDGFHCPQMIMRGADPGPERWASAGLAAIRDKFTPSGPIVLVGNGYKANAVGAEGWSASMSREIRRTFPGRTIHYRPKREFREPSVVRDRVVDEGSIESVISGASLVVCRHSNVAVDACRLGVPVVCQDGAAACIYPSKLSDADKQPSLEKRMEFLRRLAWWQWSTSEAIKGEPWPWIVRQLA